MENLTEKQKRFIDYYIQTGNASESSKLAGYKGTNLDVIGNQNLVKLGKYIQPRLEKVHDEIILTAEERQIILSDMVRDNENTKIADKLRAIDLLNKMDGQYIEKVEVNNVDTDWFIDLTTDELRRLAYPEKYLDTQKEAD